MGAGGKDEDEFRTALVQVFRARTPVVLIETHEERRVLAEIHEIARSPELVTQREVQVYSVTRGLSPYPGLESGNAGQTPAAALAEAASCATATTFVFLDLHHVLGEGRGRTPDPIVIRRIQDFADAVQQANSPSSTLIIVAPSLTLPPELDKAVTVLEFPLPDKDDLHEILTEFIAVNTSDRLTIDLDASEQEQLVKAALGLTVREAENAFARALVRDGVLDERALDVVLAEKRQAVRKGGLLEFVAAEGSLDSIGGLGNLKSWLERRTDAWTDEAQEWGLPYPKGVLITGVPGCGKSLTSKCVSVAWKLPLLRLDLGRLFGGIVGASEENMRSAIAMAEAVAPSILYVDEIEKGFNARSHDGDSGASARVFGTFLTWMQEKTAPVFVIATSNNIGILPPELLRKGRFDEIFFVDLPTAAERASIWRIHLKKWARADTPIGDLLAAHPDAIDRLVQQSAGFSGAEIEQAVIAACFDAFNARRALQVDDVEKALEYTAPLSETQPEKIAEVRASAAQHAAPATAAEDEDPTGTGSGGNGQASAGQPPGIRRVDY